MPEAARFFCELPKPYLDAVWLADSAQPTAVWPALTPLVGLAARALEVSYLNPLSLESLVVPALFQYSTV